MAVTASKQRHGHVAKVKQHGVRAVPCPNEVQMQSHGQGIR